MFILVNIPCNFGALMCDGDQKDQIILATGRGILEYFWVPQDIESCSFQNLLVFGFPETCQIWYHLDNFYFHHLKGESENPWNLPKWPLPVAKMIWSFHEKRNISSL